MMRVQLFGAPCVVCGRPADLLVVGYSVQHWDRERWASTLIDVRSCRLPSADIDHTTEGLRQYGHDSHAGWAQRRRDEEKSA